jgi:hypothetical protein
VRQVLAQANPAVLQLTKCVSFAVKELVDVYVANIAGPQASQLVMLTRLCKCL